MGYRAYRRKHTVSYSHYHTMRERWIDFKVKIKFFAIGVAMGAIIVILIVGAK